MAYFGLKKSAEILVDASPFGLGAMLTQHGRVVCYASRALKDVESRYSQTERSIRCGKISYISIMAPHSASSPITSPYWESSAAASLHQPASISRDYALCHTNIL